MSRRLAVPAVLLTAAAVALGACSSSASDGSSTSAAETTTSTTVVTTTTAAPTTTLPAKPTGSDTPEHAAQALYDAWKVGDKGAAARMAEPVAVDQIWKTAPGEYHVYSGCDSGEFGTSGCLFRGMSGTIQFTMERRQDPGGAVHWVVIEAVFSEP